MKEKVHISQSLFVKFLEIIPIPIDFDILFLMYVICADQFSLLSMIMPRNLVLLLRSIGFLLPNIHCYVVIMFYSCSMKHHIVSFL